MLRVDNCKERQTRRNRTYIPVTTNWIPTFPNGEEVNRVTERLSSIFGTNYMSNRDMGADPHPLTYTLSCQVPEIFR